MFKITPAKIAVATFFGLAACNTATGVPSYTPEARPLPPNAATTGPRGIQYYPGTNEPVRVSFDACRQLNAEIRAVNRPPRTNQVRVRIPRNGGSIGDALEDAFNDALASNIENLANQGNAQINRQLAQGRIDRLDRQCTQQRARENWARQNGLRY